LLEKIKATILLTPDECKGLIIDFKKVVGIDASAIASFKKLRNFSKNMHFNLFFSGLSEPIKKSLIDGGVISDKDNGLIGLFPTLDMALETLEEDCLKDYSDSVNDHHSMEDWLSLELGSVQRFQALKNYAEFINYEPGDHLCEQNEFSNNIFLIGAGRVSVVYQDANGKSTRVRSMIGNSIVGEMSFYRETQHVATVQAEEQTAVYKLSKENMALMNKENPDLSSAFQAFIIRTLSTRLDLLLHDMNDLEL
jgi:SulP family sulfate permease